MQLDGCLFPSFGVIREVSLQIAAAVAEGIIKSGRATIDDAGSRNNKTSRGSIRTDLSFPALMRMCEVAMYDPNV